MRDARVLARAAVRAVELDPGVAPHLAGSVLELVAAVRSSEAAFNGSTDAAAAARRAALAAAAEATLIVEQGASMAIGALVAQVRSMATDLLQALGADHAQAIEQVRAAAGSRSAAAG